MKKRLYRSAHDRMLAGVCGGIAEYFQIDPTLVRLGWVAFTALGGSGILACAGHGTNSVGDSLTTGIYRQV